MTVDKLIQAGVLKRLGRQLLVIDETGLEMVLLGQSVATAFPLQFLEEDQTIQDPEPFV